MALCWLRGFQCFVFATTLLGTFPQSCRTQQASYPLQGQTVASALVAPGDASTGSGAQLDINTSVLLERVVEFHLLENCYSAIWWVVLTWRDSAAAEAVAASTGAFMAAAGGSGGGCSRPCESSQLAVAGCCDGIWLPHIEMPNLVEYTEDQLPRYRISVNASTGLVTWSTRLVGKWYAPLDFRAYPFDHQHLLLELALADSQSTGAALVWEHVAKLNNTAHTKGADLSGWRVKWAKGKVYDSRACYARFAVAAPSYTAGAANLTATTTTPSAIFKSIGVEDRYLPRFHDQGSTKPPGCGSYSNVYDEGRALYGPVVLVADVMIKRVASYYVIVNLLPVLIISSVTFVIFFMPCDALGDRLVVVMTLLLALTALQFVFDFPPANYINALQQMVLVSYVMMLILCIESLIVNRIVVLPQRLQSVRACQRKYQKLMRSLVLWRTTGATGILTRKDSLSLVAAAAAGAVGRSTRGSAPRTGGSKLKPKAGRGKGAGRTGPDASASSVDRCDKSASVTAAGTTQKSAGDHDVGGSGASARAPSHPHRAPLPPPPGLTAPQGAQAAFEHPETPNLPGGCVSRVVPPAAAAAASLRIDMAPINPVYDSAALPTLSEQTAPVREGTSGGGSSTNRQPSTTSSAMSLPPPPPPTKTSTPLSAAAHSQLELMADSALGLRDGADLDSAPAALHAPSVSGSGCVRARRLWLVLRSWCLTVWRAPGDLYDHCKEDVEFAWFVATRIDKWCGLVCFALYAVTVSVLMWFQTQVGDHKLMLGDRPGNM